MSITFIARTMEPRCSSIVLKMHKCLLACDTCLLSDDIVDVRFIQREHSALHTSVGEVSLLKPFENNLILLYTYIYIYHFAWTTSKARAVVHN